MAAVQSPSRATRESILLDPGVVTSPTNLVDATASARAKVAIWRQVVDPAVPEHLAPAMRAVLRAPSLPAVQRLLGNLDRFHAGNAEVIGELADLFMGIREFKFALRLAKRAFVLRPETPVALGYRVAWRCLMQAGDIGKSSQLAKWWIAAGEGEAAHQALCDSAARSGNAGAFVHSLEAAMRGGFFPLGWQVRVSQLAKILTRAREVEGATRAAFYSRRIVGASGFHVQYQDLLDRRDEAGRALTTVAARIPASPLRDGLRFLAAGDTAEAIDAYRRFVDSGAPLPEALRELVPAGTFQGHPYWHLANPYFLVWSSGTIPGDSQEAWRTDRAVIRGLDPETTLRGYRDWLARDVPARAHFEDLVSSLDRRSVRVLDVGCGNGEWLRYLAEEVGVPLDNLMGMDLHESRVVATRAQLLEAARSGAHHMGAPDDIVRRNVQRQNLLELDRETCPGFENIDVLALFVVTGCFDDSQLNEVLGRLARFGPRFIFTTTVTRRWDMWHGRQDEEMFFQRHGYREVARHLLAEPLTDDAFATLLLPRRYWTNLSARIYQRI